MLVVFQRLALSFTHLYCGQGDWVWLKKFETGAIHHLRQSSTSILRKVGTGAEWGRGGKVVWGPLHQQGIFILLFIPIETHFLAFSNSCLIKPGRKDHAGLHLTNLPGTDVSQPILGIVLQSWCKTKCTTSPLNKVVCKDRVVWGKPPLFV